MRNHRKNINIPNGMKGSKASRSKHSKGGSRKRHYQADFRNPSLTDYGRNTRNRGKRCSKQVQLTLMSAMQYHNMIWQEMQESENRRVASLTPAGQSSTWLWEYRRILESHKTQNHTSLDASRIQSSCTTTPQQSWKKIDETTSQKPSTGQTASLQNAELSIPKTEQTCLENKSSKTIEDGAKKDWQKEPYGLKKTLRKKLQEQFQGSESMNRPSQQVPNEEQNQNQNQSHKNHPQKSQGGANNHGSPERHQGNGGSQTTATFAEVARDGHMGDEGSEGGIEIALYDKGTCLEGYRDRFGRVTGGHECSARIPGERGLRANDDERVHSKTVRRSKGREGSTDSGLSPAKRLPEPATLQNGGSENVGNNSATRRFPGEDRSKGCISSYTHSQGPQKVLASTCGREDLSVQGTPIWPECGSTDLFESAQGSTTTSKGEIRKDGRVFRRHMCRGEHRGRSEGARHASGDTPTELRIYCQQEKDLPDSQASARISGTMDRYEQDDTIGTHREDQEDQEGSESCLESRHVAVAKTSLNRGVDEFCLPSNEDGNINDQRIASGYPTSTIPRESVERETRETVGRIESGTQTVAQELGAIQWKTLEGTGVHYGTLDGCIRNSWGAVWKESVHQGKWTREEKKLTSNQKECLAILKALKVFKLQLRNNVVRIHSDNMTAVSNISRQGGTHSKVILRITKEDMDVCHEEWYMVKDPTYKRVGEYTGRPSQSWRNPQGRVSLDRFSNGEDRGGIWQSDDTLVCQQGEQEMSRLCDERGGCVQNQLEGHGNAADTSTSKFDPKGSEEIVRRQSGKGNFGDAGMEESSILPFDTGDANVRNNIIDKGRPCDVPQNLACGK